MERFRQSVCFRAVFGLVSRLGSRRVFAFGHLPCECVPTRSIMAFDRSEGGKPTGSRWRLKKRAILADFVILSDVPEQRPAHCLDQRRTATGDS